MVPPNTEVGSPIRATVQTPSSAPESVGTSHVISVRPEGTLGQNQPQNAIGPLMAPPTEVPVPTPVPTPAPPSNSPASPSYRPSSPSAPSAQPKSVASQATQVKSTPVSLGTKITAKPPVYGPAIPKGFVPPPSSIGVNKYVSPNTIPTPTPSQNDMQKAIKGGVDSIGSFLKRFTPQIGRGWLA